MTAVDELQDPVAMDELIAHLREEAAHLTTFAQLLDDEAKMLGKAHKPHVLRMAVRAKEAAAAQLQEDEGRRLHLLERVGISATGSEQLAVLEKLAEQQPELLEVWSLVRQQAQVAKNLNRRNGRMLQVHAKYVKSALADMRIERNKSILYDARGRTHKLR
jgi:flagellar biosynthesis/type III secretory pathway chaperone